MRRTIHCPDAPDICDPGFACYEDQPWNYTKVTPGLTITPDDEDTPTEWTVVRTYHLEASLRCECLRASLSAKVSKGDKEIEDELEELLTE